MGTRGLFCILAASIMLSVSLSGCLSLAIGREMMEGARGEPKVYDVTDSYRLAYTFTTNGIDSYQHSNQTNISIDHTVSDIIINFRVQLDADSILGPLGVNISQWTGEERYVEAWLYDAEGSEWWHMRTEEDLAMNRSEYESPPLTFPSGEWNLVVDSRGFGWVTDLMEAHDSYELTITLVRPCMTFPESPDICTPLLELDG